MEQHFDGLTCGPGQVVECCLGCFHRHQFLVSTWEHDRVQRHRLPFGVQIENNQDNMEQHFDSLTCGPRQVVECCLGCFHRHQFLVSTWEHDRVQRHRLPFGVQIENNQDNMEQHFDSLTCGPRQVVQCCLGCFHRHQFLVSTWEHDRVQRHRLPFGVQIENNQDNMEQHFDSLTCGPRQVVQCCLGCFH